MIHRRGVAAGVGLVLLMTPRFASSQSFEVGGAFVFTGGYRAGSAAATETRNPSTGTAPLTLFQTDSRVSSTPGVEVRAGVFATRRLLVYGELDYGRPTLRTHVSSDFEGAPDTVVETTASSYRFGAGLDYQLGGATWVPFVSGGAGQLREVPEGGEVLTALELHAGGGLRRTLTHGRHPLGLRGEVVATYRSRAIGFDSKRHVLPSAGAGLTWRF